MSKLTGDAPTEDQAPSRRVIFQEKVRERTAETWPDYGTAEEKWQVLCAALTETAEEKLGTVVRRQPDWFHEATNNLEPLIQKRNVLYGKWLASNSPTDLAEFRRARGEARQAVRRAKNSWFQAKADEAQRACFSGKIVWKCIRDIQCGRRGLVPTGIATITDENGNPCTTPLSQ